MKLKIILGLSILAGTAAGYLFMAEKPADTTMQTVACYPAETAPPGARCTVRTLVPDHPVGSEEKKS